MILCAGEALIDMLPRQSAKGEAAFAPYPGGAVFNTAVALARLGQKTGFCSGISDDLFGAQLMAHLRANGVDTGCVALSERPTTLAFVQLSDGHAKYAFYDENTAGRMLEGADLPQDLAGIEAMFFGGISLAVEPCGEAYASLCLRAAAQRTVMIDPNIRPDFIRDEARYRARLAGMLAVADIVKLSDEDLEWLEGPGDVDAAVAGLMRKGPKLVCITQGGDGVTGYTGDHKVHVPASPVTVVDTVGAGDTFNAGFLAALAKNGVLDKVSVAGLGRDHLEQALSLGARAAAVTVSRAGANPPYGSEL